MKSMIMLGVFLSLGLCCTANSSSNCYGGHDLKGKQNLIDSIFREKDYAGFPRKFREFCEMNRDLISCEQTVVKSSDLKTKSHQYAASHPCGETYVLPPDGKKKATLFAFTEKTPK